MPIKNKFIMFSSALLLTTTTVFAQTDEDAEITQCMPQAEVDQMTDEQIENLELPLCNEEIIDDDDIITEDSVSEDVINDEVVEEQIMVEEPSVQ